MRAFCCWSTLLLSMILAACAGAPSSSNPNPLVQGNLDYLSAPKTCAILYGTTDAVTDDRAQAVWDTVLKSIVEDLRDSLMANRYRVPVLLLPPARQSSGRQMLGEAVARHKCARVIQLQQEINTDAAGPFVKYNIQVMRFLPSLTSGAVTTSGMYSNSIRYTRDMRFMETFRMTELSARLFSDLKASGALQGLD